MLRARNSINNARKAAKHNELWRARKDGDVTLTFNTF